MNVLSVKGLTKRYPNFLLQDISFDFPQGKIMGLNWKKWCRKKHNFKIHPKFS